MRQGEIELLTFAGASSEVTGGLPRLPSFAVEFSLEKFELNIHDQAVVRLFAFFSQSKNMVSLMVNDQEGRRIAQAIGTAFSIDGSGMILMFRAPGAAVPVNLVPILIPEPPDENDGTGCRVEGN